MLLLIHLIIRFRLESGVLQRVLRLYPLAEIVNHMILESLAIPNLRPNIQQLAHLFANRLVEIQQKLPSFLKERPDIILIILKER